MGDPNPGSYGVGMDKHSFALAHGPVGSSEDSVTDSALGMNMRLRQCSACMSLASDIAAEEWSLAPSVSTPFPQPVARSDCSVQEPVLLSHRRLAACRGGSHSTHGRSTQVTSKAILARDFPVLSHTSSYPESAFERTSDAELLEMPSSVSDQSAQRQVGAPGVAEARVLPLSELDVALCSNAAWAHERAPQALQDAALPSALPAKMHLIRHLSQLAPSHANFLDDDHIQATSASGTHKHECSSSRGDCPQDQQAVIAERACASSTARSKMSPSMPTKSALRPSAITNDAPAVNFTQLATASHSEEAYAVPRACTASNHALAMSTHSHNTFEIQQKERLRLEARDQAVVLTKMKRALHAHHLSFARVTSDVLLAGWDAQLESDFVTLFDEIEKLRRCESVHGAVDANVGEVVEAMDIDQD